MNESHKTVAVKVKVDHERSAAGTNAFSENAEKLCRGRETNLILFDVCLLYGRGRQIMYSKLLEE